MGPLTKSCGPFFCCLGFLPEGRGIVAAGRGPFPKGYGIVTAGHIISRFRRSIRLLASKGQCITAGSCTVLTNDRGPYAIGCCTISDGYGIFSFCRSIDPCSQSIIAGSSPIVIVVI